MQSLCTYMWTRSEMLYILRWITSLELSILCFHVSFLCLCTNIQYKYIVQYKNCFNVEVLCDNKLFHKSVIQNFKCSDCTVTPRSVFLHWQLQSLFFAKVWCMVIAKNKKMFFLKWSVQPHSTIFVNNS